MLENPYPRQDGKNPMGISKPGYQMPKIGDTRKGQSFAMPQKFASGMNAFDPKAQYLDLLQEGQSDDPQELFKQRQKYIQLEKQQLLRDAEFEGDIEKAKAQGSQPEQEQAQPQQAEPMMGDPGFQEFIRKRMLARNPFKAAF